MRVLIVTWPGGGNVPPAIGLGRHLVEHGHDVRIFGSTSLGGRVAAAGCRLDPWPAEFEIDPSAGRAFEDQWDRIYHGILLGPAFGATVHAVLAAEPPDVVVVDFMLLAAAFAVERSGLPLVQLVHLTFRNNAARDPNDDPDAEWGWRWGFAVGNRVRAAMGLEPLPIGQDNVRLAMVRRATSALVVMPREFDDWPDKPEHVTHVGPIFEEALPPIGGEPPQASPWREDDRPLIVISLGSTYMHQERLLERIGRSVASPDRRVILLTGHDLAPADLPGVPGEVEIRRFVPHAAILPHAALVITHGGMGSLMAAFAAGVPTICLPLGRDQDANAARAAELGTSIVLAPDADERTIAEAVGRALASAEMRASARQMQAALRGYETAQLAVEAVERAGRARPEPIPR